MRKKTTLLLVWITTLVLLILAINLSSCTSPNDDSQKEDRRPVLKQLIVVKYIHSYYVDTIDTKLNPNSRQYYTVGLNDENQLVIEGNMFQGVIAGDVRTFEQLRYKDGKRIN